MEFAVLTKEYAVEANQLFAEVFQLQISRENAKEANKIYAEFFQLKISRE
jgi:hypothetical protein